MCTYLSSGRDGDLLLTERFYLLTVAKRYVSVHHHCHYVPNTVTLPFLFFISLCLLYFIEFRFSVEGNAISDVERR